MKYYPLFLDITSCKCLVLGAGSVARRKIASLMKANPLEILVIDPYLCEKDFLSAFHEEYALQPKVTYLHRNFKSEDLENVRLAFSATGSSAVNNDFAKLCLQKNIHCNVIDNPLQGDFIVPAHLDYDNLVLAVSSSGVSPAFTKALKDDLNNWISKSYVPYLRLLKFLRPLILENVAEYKRADIFRALAAKDFREEIMGLLELRKFPELHRKLAQVLPDTVISGIDDRELIHIKEK